MKEIKATLIALVVVLGTIAFVSPVSAYLIENGQVSCDAGETTWTFDVNCDEDDDHDISHWTVAWCSETDVKEVWVNGVKLDEDGDPKGWDYSDLDGVQGIKIDYQVNKGETVTVKIVLSGCYYTANVQYGIKADGPDFPIQYGTVYGPDHTIIPEFSTIAIPVTAILGLLFFFNRRKRREE